MPELPLTCASGATALSHLGVIRARGADAADFLHGQLTQDVRGLATGAACFADYLSPKGRVLASCVVLRRAPDELLLLCHHSVLAAALRRLALFVLRARVTLEDATPAYAMVGLLGAATRACVPEGAPPWSAHAAGPACAVALHPADGVARALWIAPVGEPAPQADAVDVAAWLLAEVRCGVVTVSAPVADAYVPQMLNHESVGAVHFHKGCYPGQEVVARSQFRGSVKRRTALTRCAAALAVGDEVFSAGASIGTVVQSAALPDGGCSALVVLPTAAAHDALRARSPEGAPLQIEALPYALVSDV